jgi:hypothetical protein
VAARRLWGGHSEAKQPGTAVRADHFQSVLAGIPLKIEVDVKLPGIIE